METAVTREMEQMAIREGISAAALFREIALAIDDGINSVNPEVRTFWDNIPRKGIKPVPEEYIAHCAILETSIYREETFIESNDFFYRIHQFITQRGRRL